MPLYPNPLQVGMIVPVKIPSMEQVVLFENYEYNIRGSLNKFPAFFCMVTFIDSIHMKL